MVSVSWPLTAKDCNMVKTQEYSTSVVVNKLLAHLYKSTESHNCHLEVGMGMDVSVTLESFTSTFFFHVMGNTLSASYPVH